MGEAALKSRYFTLEEYFEMQANTLEKYEYNDGKVTLLGGDEITAMAGGTPRHSLLANNVGRVLGNALVEKPCLTYNSDLHIAFDEEHHSYADVSVICGEMEHYEESPNAAKNPILIVEVLSDSTEQYDRGEKFRKYRQIKSFKEYVLVSQNSIFVETFFKPEGIDFWQYKSYQDLSENIQLQSINCLIAMKDIYLGWVSSL